MQSTPAEPGPAFAKLCALPSLMAAARRAARGRRGRRAVADFEFAWADQLLAQQGELLTGQWQHGRYVRFQINEPKRRIISAAAFRDRVVHHALCAVIEPRFERLFIADSYANGVGKGTHRAPARMAALASEFPYVLRMDIRQHFPSIDHALLLAALARQVPEPELMALIGTILASADSDASHGDTPAPVVCRRRPAGRLPPTRPADRQPDTGLVQRVHACRRRVREARVVLPGLPALRGQLRAVFGHDKAELWRHKQSIIERLARLRLRAHEGSAQVCPTRHDVPWLGFVVYPGRLRVKARKVRHATRRLGALYDAMCGGDISFAEFDASVQGWINHVKFADPGGLRAHVLQPFVWPAGSRQRHRGQRG